ncbi:glycosyltransferase family 92 RCOM_0530710 [Olea europaea subsp. europaea]|uniref:Glycosyltransferase family 92 protein n=1 Tax=Olea europaea subsp. europaea TaxID=158383 RepID=A0A8S0P7Z2_OLEEU|nr:glycosyltransferase family 92 RCOM_0530710 [Olea europaea subsp. europaea]
MNTSRKRKRIFRPSYYSSQSSTYLFSVRSFVLSFSFFIFLYLISYTIPFSSLAFRPVLVISSLASSSSNIAKRIQEFDGFITFPWKIENRVLFPDHVLLLVSSLKKDGLIKKSAKELECVYYGKTVLEGNSNGSSGERDPSILVKQNVLSVDEYDECRSIVRCPLPSMNYSSVVNLGRRGKSGVLEEDTGSLMNIQTVHSWENVVYAASLDGNTAVVFVKGLNLRSDRESNPRKFSCHFGLGNRKIDGRFMLRTKALTAAQEVVRCSLPRSVQANPDKAGGIRVTVGIITYGRSRIQEHVLVPSVAKISSFKSEEKKKSEGKYVLCACTMVWNQASALREWIMYHAWLGVERWFIYDNNGDDGIEEVIQELDLEGYNVTRHVWPWIKMQEAGFSHCVLRAKDECNWVSFMDVDEFFYFPYSKPRHKRFRKFGYAGQNSLRTLVANISSSSRSIAEIRTSCHSFGPSGLNSPPSQGVTGGYTCRLQSPERHKSIIRPDALDNTLLNVVHHFHLRKGFKYLNLHQSTAVINHYKYQVWEVFRAKFYRRVATYVADWQQNQNEGSRDRVPGLGTEAIEPPDWPIKFCEFGTTD